jgi:hypothetical protein
MMGLLALYCTYSGKAGEEEKTIKNDFFLYYCPIFHYYSIPWTRPACQMAGRPDLLCLISTASVSKISQKQQHVSGKSRQSGPSSHTVGRN